MKIFCLLRLIYMVHTLSVIPRSIPELEGDPEVHFFCREDIDIFATNIIWWDPWDNIHNPGSTNDNANEKIHAEGSRLSIYNVNRNDTGTYRCVRNSNHTEFAEGTLTVIVPPKIFNKMPLQEISYGDTSLIKCEVESIPFANVHWLHISYNNETGEKDYVEITSTYDPRFTIVENGLEISNVQLSDEGTYRCYVYNAYGTAILDILAAFKAPPEPSLKYYNHTIELNQPVILNCSVTAVPCPEFQWILHLAITGDHLPDSSWNSTYTDKMATSTLNYTFGTADLNDCLIRVTCIATNRYDRSEHHFTLSLNSSENYCSRPTSWSGKSDSHAEVVISSTVGGATVTVLLVALLIFISLLVCQRRQCKKVDLPPEEVDSTSEKASPEEVDSTSEKASTEEVDFTPEKATLEKVDALDNEILYSTPDTYELTPDLEPDPFCLHMTDTSSQNVLLH